LISNLERGWTVLLIGGSSATGKSYLARQLALHFQIPCAQIDDIRIAIHQVADREKNADLFFFLEHSDYLWTHESDHLVTKLVDVARAMWPAVNMLISKHLACDEPIIFEGDGILPELLTQRDLSVVKSLFLIDSKEHLLRRDVIRNRGYDIEKKADRQAEFSFQFGRELEKQAIKYQFPVVQTTPEKTLLERVMTVLANK
jgi:2-phosphoglycerate kinase